MNVCKIYIFIPETCLILDLNLSLVMWITWVQIVKTMVFSSSPEWMLQLDHKEDWVRECPIRDQKDAIESSDT